MKRFLGVVFACVAAVVLSISASAAEEGGAVPESPFPEYPLLESGFWAKASDSSYTSEELRDMMRQVMIDAGYTEVQAIQTVAVNPEDFSQETLDLAYSDIEQADEETKKKILAARDEIIFGSNNDGWSETGMGMVYNSFEGTFTLLPRFSDLFPGWDLPIDNTTECADGPSFVVEEIPEEDLKKLEADSSEDTMNPEKSPKSAVSSAGKEKAEEAFEALEEFSAEQEEAEPIAMEKTVQPRYTVTTTNYPSVDIPKKVSGSGITQQYFAQIYTLAPGAVNPVTARVNSLSAGMSTCNIGATNMKTGNSISFRQRLYVGDSYSDHFSSDGQSYVGLRASSYDCSGTGNISVTRNNYGT